MSRPHRPPSPGSVPPPDETVHVACIVGCVAASPTSIPGTEVGEAATQPTIHATCTVCVGPGGTSDPGDGGRWGRDTTYNTCYMYSLVGRRDGSRGRRSVRPRHNLQYMLHVQSVSRPGGTSDPGDGGRWGRDTTYNTCYMYSLVGRRDGSRGSVPGEAATQTVHVACYCRSRQVEGRISGDGGRWGRDTTYNTCYMYSLVGRRDGSRGRRSPVRQRHNHPTHTATCSMSRRLSRRDWSSGTEDRWGRDTTYNTCYMYSLVGRRDGSRGRRSVRLRHNLQYMLHVQSRREEGRIPGTEVGEAATQPTIHATCTFSSGGGTDPGDGGRWGRDTTYKTCYMYSLVGRRDGSRGWRSVRPRHNLQYMLHVQSRRVEGRIPGTEVGEAATQPTIHATCTVSSGGGTDPGDGGRWGRDTTYNTCYMYSLVGWRDGSRGRRSVRPRHNLQYMLHVQSCRVEGRIPGTEVGGAATQPKNSPAQAVDYTRGWEPHKVSSWGCTNSKQSKGMNQLHSETFWYIKPYTVQCSSFGSFTIFNRYSALKCRLAFADTGLETQQGTYVHIGRNKLVNRNIPFVISNRREYPADRSPEVHNS